MGDPCGGLEHGWVEAGASAREALAGRQAFRKRNVGLTVSIRRRSMGTLPMPEDASVARKGGGRSGASALALP